MRRVAGVRLTEGGLETSLVFDQGVELPHFAAFPLLQDDDGRRVLRAYWEPYRTLVQEVRAPFVVDTATWRANPDWGALLGYDAAALDEVNVAAARFAREVADDLGAVAVNGVVGPRGDGYVVGAVMSADEAGEYHLSQVHVVAGAGVDKVLAITFTYTADEVVFV